MASLDLTTDRGFNTVTIQEKDKKEPTVLKLPKELTVAEVERILDLQAQAESTARQPVDSGRLDNQLREFYNAIFAQLLIMFRHYQPEIQEEYLRINFTTEQALEITGFFNTNRFLKNNEPDGSEQKKN